MTAAAAAAAIVIAGAGRVGTGCWWLIVHDRLTSSSSLAYCTIVAYSARRSCKNCFHRTKQAKLAPKKNRNTNQTNNCSFFVWFSCLSKQKKTTKSFGRSTPFACSSSYLAHVRRREGKAALQRGHGVAELGQAVRVVAQQTRLARTHQLLPQSRHLTGMPLQYQLMLAVQMLAGKYDNFLVGCDWPKIRKKP